MDGLWMYGQKCIKPCATATIGCKKEVKVRGKHDNRGRYFEQPKAESLQSTIVQVLLQFKLNLANVSGFYYIIPTEFSDVQKNMTPMIDRENLTNY